MECELRIHSILYICSIPYSPPSIDGVKLSAANQIIMMMCCTMKLCDDVAAAQRRCEEKMESIDMYSMSCEMMCAGKMENENLT